MRALFDLVEEYAYLKNPESSTPDQDYRVAEMQLKAICDALEQLLDTCEGYREEQGQANMSSRYGAMIAAFGRANRELGR